MTNPDQNSDQPASSDVPDAPLLDMSPAMQAALADMEALAAVKAGSPPPEVLSEAELAMDEPDDLFAGMEDEDAEIDEAELQARAIAHATRRAQLVASTGELEMLRNQVKHLRTRLKDEEARVERAERIIEPTKNDLKATRKRFAKVAERETDLNNMVERLRHELPLKAQHDLLKELMPALDSLDSVIKHLQGDEGLSASSTEAVAILEKDWNKALGLLQISAFDAVGQRFDPVVHSAISEVESAEIPPGMCVRQVGRGYLMEHRLLRPARVIVSKAPQAVETGEV